MAAVVITFVDECTRQLIEAWDDDKEFIAADQICVHLEERFHVRAIHVVAAVDQGDFLTLRLTTDTWEKAREFGLLADGSLAW